MERRVIAAFAVALALTSGCDLLAPPLEANALLGLWLVDGGRSARELRDDRTGRTPDLQFDELLHDETGWQVLRAGAWGVRGERGEVAGQPTVGELIVVPALSNVFGDDDGDTVEGVVSLEGDVLVTITPYSDGPITHRRVPDLPR